MTSFGTSHFGASQKRKWVPEEAHGVIIIDERQSKRLSKQNPTSKPVFAQLPTPDESSEDEDTRMDREHWYQRRNIADLLHIKTGSMSSVRVNLGHLDYDEDDVMIMSPSTPSLSLLTSTSASDQGDSMCPPPTPFDERMPTPTTTSTPYRRAWHSQLHTMLSPVMGEEGNFPSPLSPMQAEAFLAMAAAGKGLKGLSGYSPADAAHMVGVQENGRTAKLYLGFRDDCEKCVQKVPGHNSHIVWS